MVLHRLPDLVEHGLVTARAWLGRCAGRRRGEGARHSGERNGECQYSEATRLVLLGHADKSVMRRVGAPHLARSAQQLTDPNVAVLSGDAAELAPGRIETQQRTGTEVAHPHDVVLVDINPVRLRPIAR